MRFTLLQALASATVLQAAIALPLKGTTAVESNEEADKVIVDPPVQHARRGYTETSIHIGGRASGRRRKSHHTDDFFEDDYHTIHTGFRHVYSEHIISPNPAPHPHPSRPRFRDSELDDRFDHHPRLHRSHTRPFDNEIFDSFDHHPDSSRTRPSGHKIFEESSHSYKYRARPPSPDSDDKIDDYPYPPSKKVYNDIPSPPPPPPPQRQRTGLDEEIRRPLHRNKPTRRKSHSSRKADRISDDEDTETEDGTLPHHVNWRPPTKKKAEKVADPWSDSEDGTRPYHASWTPNHPKNDEEAAARSSKYEQDRRPASPPPFSHSKSSRTRQGTSYQSYEQPTFKDDGYEYGTTDRKPRPARDHNKPSGTEDAYREQSPERTFDRDHGRPYAQRKPASSQENSSHKHEYSIPVREGKKSTTSPPDDGVGKTDFFLDRDKAREKAREDARLALEAKDREKAKPTQEFKDHKASRPAPEPAKPDLKQRQREYFERERKRKEKEAEEERLKNRKAEEEQAEFKRLAELREKKKLAEERQKQEKEEAEKKRHDARWLARTEQKAVYNARVFREADRVADAQKAFDNTFKAFEKWSANPTDLLTWEKVPWPVFEPPNTIVPDDITEDNVEKFFKAQRERVGRKDYRKYYLNMQRSMNINAWSSRKPHIKPADVLIIEQAIQKVSRGLNLVKYESETEEKERKEEERKAEEEARRRGAARYASYDPPRDYYSGPSSRSNYYNGY